MVNVISCSVCNKKKEYYAKGMCKICYGREYSKGRLDTRHQQNSWTKAEQNMIILLYPRTTKQKVLEKLPGRTWEAIKMAAAILGVKREPSIYNRTKIGKLAEHRTAKLLYDDYGLVTFPSPNPIYDLILIKGNKKLEIKSKEDRYWKVSQSQFRSPQFCDFLILWENDNVFIIPYEDWANKLGHKKFILSIHVMQYKDRWDLLCNG